MICNYIHKLTTTILLIVTVHVGYGQCTGFNADLTTLEIQLNSLRDSIVKVNEWTLKAKRDSNYRNAENVTNDLKNITQQLDFTESLVPKKPDSCNCTEWDEPKLKATLAKMKNLASESSLISVSSAPSLDSLSAATDALKSTIIECVSVVHSGCTSVSKVADNQAAELKDEPVFVEEKKALVESSTALTKTTSSSISSSSKNLYYSVQLLSSPFASEAIPIDGLSEQVFVIQENDTYKHRIGKVKTMSEAVELKNKARKAGIADAFIVAMLSEKRITTAQANQILKGEQIDIPVPQTKEFQPKSVTTPAPKPRKFKGKKMDMFVCLELKRLPKKADAIMEIVALENTIGMPIESITADGQIVLITGKTKDLNQFSSSSTMVKSKVSNAKPIGVASGKIVAFEDAEAHLSR